MSWEEYVDITRTLLKFNELNERERQIILLMIDGLKFRGNK